jgi:hypothetical protein
MILSVDCDKCGTRFDLDTNKAGAVRLCRRCETLNSTDIKAIIEVLKANRTPGQEHVLKLIELLSAKVQTLESCMDAFTSPTKY